MLQASMRHLQTLTYMNCCDLYRIKFAISYMHTGFKVLYLLLFSSTVLLATQGSELSLNLNPMRWA